MKKLLLTVSSLVCSAWVIAAPIAPVTTPVVSTENSEPQKAPPITLLPKSSSTLSEPAKARPVDQSNIEIVNHPEIMGQWGMEIPNNKQCVEYYNFRGNNEVIIKSDKEWSTGRYQYQLPNDRTEFLPALAMHIEYDNNQQDCSGDQVDQTGEVQQFFVKWINPQKIEFCGTEKGEQCFAVLNKTLP